MNSSETEHERIDNFHENERRERSWQKEPSLKNESNREQTDDRPPAIVASGNSLNRYDRPSR
jgi:hypothetical protein